MVSPHIGYLPVRQPRVEGVMKQGERGHWGRNVWWVLAGGGAFLTGLARLVQAWRH
jgi:hypothetical protein